MKQFKEYIVEFNYLRFRFTDSDDAMGFALEAAQHCVDKGQAQITIVMEDDESEEEDDA